MELKELFPRKATLKINEKSYTLKPFNLAAQIWVDSEFSSIAEPSGLKELSEKFLKLDLYSACKVAYHLLEDKHDFPSLESFIEAAGKYENLMRIYYAICETIGYSQPMLDDLMQESELKKRKGPELPAR